jgi:hypothetical protein
LIAGTGGDEVRLIALEEPREAEIWTPAFAIVALTPEQRAKHTAYRAKQLQKKEQLDCFNQKTVYRTGQEAKAADVGLALTRSVSPPFSPPAGPIGKFGKKQQLQLKAAAAAVAGLSAKDRKLMHNRAMEFTQTKVQHLKEQQLALQATLQAKLQQHALLLELLDVAQAVAVAVDQTSHVA